MASPAKFPVVRTAVAGGIVQLSPAAPRDPASPLENNNEKIDLKISSKGDFFDISLAEDGDFQLIGGLDSSLFVTALGQRRATEDERPISAQRGGWIGNQYKNSADPELGSKIWLSNQARLTRSETILLEERARSAFSWLVDFGYAVDINVRLVANDEKSITISVIITTVTGNIVTRLIRILRETPDV